MRLLILNGSLGGANGNTAKMIAVFTRDAQASCDIVHLKERTPSIEELTLADGFAFTTGVYWDSWGSPLQSFLEQATPLEADMCWFGKPAAVLVSMHSVGGKEVASRLQGVLNTFGLYIPPMCSLTYSFVNQVSLSRSDETAVSLADDIWSLGDLKTVSHNLLVAAQQPKLKFLSWPVDRSNPHRVWLKPVST